MSNAPSQQKADLILHNGRFPSVSGGATAVAVSNGRFVAVGSEEITSSFKGPATKLIDLNKRTVIPGLNDSHLHLIRAGLNYNMELRWDGVPSLAEALRMLKAQVQRTQPPQWVRVVGGWTPAQFAEKRFPTLAEINEASPDVPVFILHLYDRAFLNQAALRAIGYDKEVPNFPSAQVERDPKGNPTGLLIAKPNATILYSTLGRGPKLSFDDQVNSTRHFMRELNRLGLTSCIDAGGGFQNYPDDYKVVEQLHQQGQLTTRIAYNLFTQKPRQELADFSNWSALLQPRQGDEMYRHNGAGEMLVYTAADFEDFVWPRPELPAELEPELKKVVRLLAEKRWPFRLHATYNQTIERALNVFEEVNREIPFGDTHWFFDHAETITAKSIDRIKALGGGIAIQHRMAYQGEAYIDRYGQESARHTPPIRQMLEAGVPVGAGTDATRVASYNPFISLYWLVSGKTIGGAQMYSDDNRLSREEALRLWTEGSSWFSTDNGAKGAIKPGQVADIAVLSSDYFSIPEEQIKSLESVLTVVGGKVVYAAQEFSSLDPPIPPAAPDWSPVNKFGGYYRGQHDAVAPAHAHTASHSHRHMEDVGFFGALGCDCFAF